MGVSVVLKQYKGSAFDGIFRELKMFTYMENYKKISQPDQDIAEVAALGSQHDGLPQLLAYKIKNNIGKVQYHPRNYKSHPTNQKKTHKTHKTCV